MGESQEQEVFLGNTTVDGRPFDYHARGVQILIGRAIVVAAFVLLSVSSSISPILNGVVIVLLAVAFPWLINRGLRFNAAMTSWSNVRFRFEGSYWRAFAVFLLYPFLAVFTLYLATPFVTRAVTRYRIARHFLGEHRFAFDSRIGPFYLAFLYSALWGALGILVSVALVWGSGVARDVAIAAQTGGQIGGSGVIVLILAAVVLYVAIFPQAAIYAAFTRNPIYAGTTLEGGPPVRVDDFSPKARMDRRQQRRGDRRVFWHAASLGPYPRGSLPLREHVGEPGGLARRIRQRGGETAVGDRRCLYGY